jgi:cytochrome c oxidase subunit 1
VWNFVDSWLEGPKVEDGDPWNLDDYGLKTAEWQWYERKIETAIADGGEEETELAADGGQVADPDADDDSDAGDPDDA